MNDRQIFCFSLLFLCQIASECNPFILQQVDDSHILNNIIKKLFTHSKFVKTWEIVQSHTRTIRSSYIRYAILRKCSEMGGDCFVSLKTDSQSRFLSKYRPMKDFLK